MPKQNSAQEREIELPQEIIESFARFLVPEIRKYYDSEQGQREFAEWEAEIKCRGDLQSPAGFSE
jgi:hypothetical protein